MAMRKFMTGAAGGLAIALGAGHMNTLQAQGTSMYQSADQRFLSHLAAANLLEVRLGQTAQLKASSPTVKQFGQRMVAGHTSMQKNWTAMASKNGLDFKANLSPQQLEQYERLRNVSGADFDRAYMGLVVQNQRNHVTAFQNERPVAHSAEARQLIDRDLAALQAHVTLAQQVSSQVGVSGGVATGVDTTSAIPGLPPRTDTTTVVGRYPQPNPQAPQPSQQGEGQKNDTGRRTVGERWTRGNVNADAQFVRDVDASHFLQVRLGRLAKDKARNSDVERFGEQMEKDHADLQKQLSKMASSNGMKYKSGMGPEHRANLERLEKLSGNAFDQAYMTFMIQSHNGYLNYWRREGRAARSAPVRQVVNRGLPTLEEHMDMAKRIGSRVGVDADAALAGRRVAAERSDPGTVIE